MDIKEITKLKNIAAKLRHNVKLFKNLEIEEVLTLIYKCHEIRTPKGKTIISQNAIDDYLYILLLGEIQITAFEYLGGGKKKEKLLRTITPGNIVGELSPFLSLRRTANAVCSQNCILLKFSNSTFKDLKKENPRLALKIYDNLLEILAEKFIFPNLYDESK